MSTQPLTDNAGLHGPFVVERLPGWLKHAEAPDLVRLHQAWQVEQTPGAFWFDQAETGEQASLLDYQARRREAAHHLAKLLEPLKGITEFCEPLLEQALATANPPLRAEVNSDELVQMRQETQLLGAILTLRPLRQSLLQAALQNFPGDAHFEPGSALAPRDSFGLELIEGGSLAAPRFRYRYASTLGMEAQQFARLCHALDLGQRYQEHLRTVFEAPGIRDQAIRLRREQLRVTTQVAWMKGEISASARQMLLSLVDGERRPAFNGKPLHICQWELFGSPLAEVLMLSADRDWSNRVEPVVVYQPGAALYPLKEYPSSRAAYLDLLVNLRAPDHIALMRSLLPQEDRLRVLGAVDAALYLEVEDSNGVWQREPDPQAALELRDIPVDGELFSHLQDAHLNRLKADAGYLAVPSAKVDEQARQARLLAWESAGLNMLNAAALVVPGLGEVMAAVAAVQMVNAVIEGSEAWEEGDRALAWAHLQSLGLNLALMAGLGLAGRAAVPVEASQALDGLVQVRLRNGQQRLWRADLDSYASEASLAGAVPDAEGIHTWQGRTFVRIEGKAYEVVRQPDGQWCIARHPDDAYRPPLRHNGQGAWRLASENPLRWQGMPLWRRLGHLVEGLDDGALVQVARVTGTRDAHVRQLLLDCQALPPLLEEALLRERIARGVEPCLLRLGADQPLDEPLVSLPLALLARMPAWPADLMLQVLEGGEVLQIYGATAAQRQVPIALMHLLQGGYLLQVQSVLSEAELKALVGPYLAATEAGRATQLGQALADFANAHRGWLFDAGYASLPGTTLPGMAVLERDFPTLPRTIARRLVEGASEAQRRQLLAPVPKVPLPMAEQAREYLLHSRLNRALEALYRGYPQSADARRLALFGLERMPGWSGEVRLEVRREGLGGELLGSAGLAAAGEVKYLIERPSGFQPLDADGIELAPAQDLCQAILQALPDSERQHLGLLIGQGQVLRMRLADLAAADRLQAMRLLGLPARSRWRRPVLEQGTGRVGYALSGRGAGNAARRMALEDRLRTLCPELDDARLGEWLDAFDEAGQGEAVQALEGRAEQLRVGLAHWTGQAGVLQQPARERLALRLSQSWRRQVFGMERSIELYAMPGTELPILAVPFEHVTRLTLRYMAVQDLPGGFLSAFTRLQRLEVNFANLGRIPPSVFGLAQLETLALRGCDVRLDADAVAGLGRMTGLRQLDLGENPLGDLLDVGGLLQLEALQLYQCGLTRWPAGTAGLDNLHTLDLRSNAITRIPPQVLSPSAERAEAMLAINQGTHINGNPIDAESRSRLRAYERQSGATLGLNVQDVRSEGVEVFAETDAREGSARWLVQVETERQGPLQALWESVAAEEQAQGLFDLFSELRDTAEFERSFIDLRERVWRLLRVIAQDVELREEVFEAASHPQTCSDGAALIFSQLETRVLIADALAAGAEQDVEQRLVDLARGLRRLDELDRIAFEDIARREADGVPEEMIDEAEIRLYYRVELAQLLALPGQFGRLSYDNAWVPPARIEEAGASVLAGETIEGRIQDLIGRSFWGEFLDRAYVERFAGLREPYYERLFQLDGQDLTSQAYREASEQVSREMEAARRQLVEQLTREVFARQP